MRKIYFLGMTGMLFYGSQAQSLSSKIQSNIADKVKEASASVYQEASASLEASSRSILDQLHSLNAQMNALSSQYSRTMAAGSANLGTDQINSLPQTNSLLIN